jgi:hypothetical protein
MSLGCKGEEQGAKGKEPNHCSYIISFDISHLVICVSRVVPNLSMRVSKNSSIVPHGTNDQMRNVK